MRPCRLAVPIATALLVGILPLAHGTTVVKFSNRELVERAEYAFHGVCVDKRSFRDADGTIVTRYTFEVKEMLKGKGAAGDTISFVQPGGAVGSEGLYIPGAARFEVGEETVVFVARPDRPGEPTFTVGLGQGKFMVTQEPGSDEKTVRRSLEGLKLFDWKTGKVAEEAVVTKLEQEVRELDGFLEEVRTYVRELEEKGR